jgi:hypothetical protein
MLKSILLATVLFTTPVLADQGPDPANRANPTCTTVEDIKEANKAASPTFMMLTEEMFQILKKAFADHGGDIPEGITQILVGRTVEAEGWVFLYGLDKDGCEAGVLRLPELMFRSIFAPAKEIPTT